MTSPLAFTLRFEKFDRRREVSFQPGLHLIYGSSGCGKTSLIHSIAGIPVSETTNYSFELKQKPDQIQVIFQNPEDQIVAHTLEAELAFSLECCKGASPDLQEEFETVKSRLEFVKDWNRHPETLSGGEKEILNLATAFSVHPQCVLIDDGLSFLNRKAKESQVQFIRQEIRRWGITVLWFTSDVNDLAYGDTMRELALSELRVLTKPIKSKDYHHRHKEGALKLVFDHLSFSYSPSEPLFSSLDGTIDGARAVGLVGQNGRGKTTLAQILAGILDPTAGQVTCLLETGPPSLAYLDQFPEKTLSMESLSQFLDRLVENGRLEQYKLQKCLNALNHHQISWDLIKNDSALDVPWSTLRMALVIILAHCNYDLLILDEPTFGLGWDQKVVLSRFLGEILKRKHLILISHDRDFIEHHCDHILDLDDGCMTRKEDVLIHD